MKRDDVMELVERGIQELSHALAAGKSDQLRAYLDVMARFPRYSFGNCILIAMQSPGATLVQGFSAWKKLGRTVVKGAKGIGIFAPIVFRQRPENDTSDNAHVSRRVVHGFKIVYVFDVSQTEGDDLPQFSTVSGDPGANIQAIENLIRDAGIELTYELISSGADGLSRKGAIVIDPNLAPARRLMTLVHEFAHEVLHADVERRKATTISIRETEAEAVAHVVCQALGLDSLQHSSDYIQLYHGDVKQLTNSLDYIQNSAARILEGISGLRATTSTVYLEDPVSV